MPNYSRFYEGDMSKLAIVIAFDPGETTGYCVMGVDPINLLDSRTYNRTRSLYEAIRECGHIEYAEIDCGARHGQTGRGIKRGHEGLNMAGECNGVQHMVNLTTEYLTAAIVLEDFILDFNQATKARHTLAPVRIISAFSYGLWMESDRFGRGREFEDRIFVQNRSLHKTTCTDDRLRSWGLYDTHSGPHARDATRAAYYFLRDCSAGNPKPDVAAEKRHMAWPHLFDDPMIAKPKARKLRPLGERI